MQKKKNSCYLQIIISGQKRGGIGMEFKRVVSGFVFAMVVGGAFVTEAGKVSR